MGKASQRRRKKKRVYQRFGGLCFYCRKPLYLSQMTIDHFYPRSKYDQENFVVITNDKDFSTLNKNLVSCCEGCNQLKKDMDPFEFADFAAKNNSFSQRFRKYNK